MIELPNSSSDYFTSILTNDDLLNPIAAALSSTKGISIHKASQVILTRVKELATVTLKISEEKSL